MAAEEAGSPSLLEQARSRATAKKRVRCSIGLMLAAHTDLAPQIQELMDNAGSDGLSYAVAAETLSGAINQKIDGQTISRHQRKRCACS